MRGLRRLVLAAVLVACSTTAVASVAAVASAAASRAQLRGFVCQTALDPAGRAVSITAVMRPVTGTQRLEMKFQLLSKPTGAASFTALTGSGLGSWQSPPAQHPPLGRRSGDVWIVHHPVVVLSAPAVYRFRVSFRWIGSHGKVLATTTKSSPTCRQPELRPDLLVESFVASPVAGHPHLNSFAAVIRNAGATAARNFYVEFSDGAKTTSHQIKRIPAHGKVTLTFTGPACTTTSPPSLTIDPQGVVDDLNRTNNTATAVCPAGP